MGEHIKLTAADGHRLGAYEAQPQVAAGNTPKGGIVILQEIFGVNSHIRSVVDDFANRGFLAIAPCLFDRVRPGIELDYTNFDVARATMAELDRNEAITDIQAAITAARDGGKVAAIGYCWGGAMADLAACRTDVDAGVSYYGRMTIDWLDEQPQVPVMYHFGAEDPLIPPDMVEQINDGRSGHPSFVYAGAGHGFNCAERDDYAPESARLALDRTLAFLEDHIC